MTVNKFDSFPEQRAKRCISAPRPTTLQKAAQATLAVALGIGLSSSASAAEWEALVLFQHTSDLFRGWPLNQREEQQQEFIAFGATLRVGKNRAFEVDLVHGLKSLDRGSWEGGSQIAARWYPGRHKNGD